jgi:hypothetical protein
MKNQWLLFSLPVFILTFFVALKFESASLERTPASSVKRVTPKLLYTLGSSEMIINVLRPNVLKKFEEEGYSFSELMDGQEFIKSNDQLYLKNKLYRDIVKSVGEVDLVTKEGQLPSDLSNHMGDIPELVKALRGVEDKGKRSEVDSVGGYKIRQVSNNASNPYLVEREGDEPRHFDHRWLKSKFGVLRLVAVVNRIDKRDFETLQDSCGEVRFIYRLGYQAGGVGSTMPFFLNVVYEYPVSNDCSDYAALWQGNAEMKDEASMAKVLLRTDGPLDKSLISFKQIELNYQSLRFTSGYMKDFGGQAMYILKIFKKEKENLVPVALENTPDVLKIQKDPKIFSEFLSFLSQEENLIKLDQGILVLPNFGESFLTNRALSFSTIGRARMANKPYTALFKDKIQELKKILKPEVFKTLKYLKSPEAVIERLDNMTCMGCHQSGGTAGFHMLGFATSDLSHHFNKQELPLSAHAYSEVERRKSYLIAMINNQSANTFRPHSNFPTALWPKLSENEDYAIPQFEPLRVRDLCVVNGAHFSAQPSCETSGAPHYKVGCSQTVSNKNMGVLFGECVIHREGESKRLFSGHVCRKGEIVESKPSALKADDYNFYAFMDKFSQSKEDVYPDFGPYGCGQPRGGTPLGRLSRRCTIEEEHFSHFDSLTADGKTFSENNLAENFIPPEICANRGGEGFDNCAASNGAGSCLEKIVRRDVLDTCYPGHFCREDFICQKIPDYHLIDNKYYQRKAATGGKHNLGDSGKINQKALNSLRESNNVGFCTPTYFLFNMRVDGHPDPVTGKPWPLKTNAKAPLRGY